MRAADKASSGTLLRSFRKQGGGANALENMHGGSLFAIAREVV